MHVAPRRVGSWGFEIGKIGLGCMSMTGVYDVDQRKDERSEAAIRRALDLGVTFIDTADSYGPFANELLVGRALAERQEEAQVATKVGLVGRSDGNLLRDGRPEHIASACEASLRRLRRDQIDLYVLQALDPETPVSKTWGAMAQEVESGRVRSLGVMTRSIELLEFLQPIFPITAVYTQFSLWNQENRAVVDWCTDRGIGLFATSPLGRGFLTGTIKPGRKFEWTDLRSKLSEFSDESLAQDRWLLEAVREVSRRKRATMSQVALAWVLAQSPTVIPVQGTTRPEHLEENAAAADLGLDALDLRQLAGEDVSEELAERAAEPIG
jgi:aryl-alcohol dehydrogenase-like predicted oxidoreductase